MSDAMDLDCMVVDEMTVTETETEIIDDKLSMFVKRLQPTSVIPDYAILFGGIRPVQVSNRTSKSNLSRLFEFCSGDIDSEVEKLYFQDQNLELGHDAFEQETKVCSSERKDSAKKQGQDDEVIAYWANYFETAKVDAEDLSKLMAIGDDVFESVIRSNKDISVDTLERVILFATGKSCSGVSKKKLIALAEYGLLPKLYQPNVVFRNVIPAYKSLRDADMSVVLQHIVMPMFRNKIAIPRPLFNGIDKEMLFSLTMTWMDTEAQELSVNTIKTLYELLEGKKQLNECNCDILVKTLEQSVRYKPDDKDIVHFFRFIVDRFGWNMQEGQLQRLELLSDIIQHSSKDVIQGLIRDKLESLASY